MTTTGFSYYKGFLETYTKLRIERLGFEPSSHSISAYTKKLYDNNQYAFFNSHNEPSVIATIHYLGFDSSIYNKKIGALNIFNNPCNLSKEKESSQALFLVDQILDYIKANDYELIICRQSLEELFWIQRLEKLGFRIMDIQCPLKLKKSNNTIFTKSNYSSTIEIRDLLPDDVDPIINFGKSAFGKSHLYADRYLPENLSDNLHEMWLKNDCTGRADFVLTSLLNNIVNGFIACLIDHDQKALLGIHHGHIDLISVIDGMRNQGIGKLLMQAALERYSELRYDVVTISTQATNIKAINLYQKIGFKMSGFEVTLHGWFN